MQHSPAGFPDPQKHISAFPQQDPYGLPDPHEQVAMSFDFCASSIVIFDLMIGPTLPMLIVIV